MTTFKLQLLTIISVGLCAQVPHNPPEQPPASQHSKQLYQAAPNRQAVSTPGRLLSLFDEAGES